jgi:stage V sporulation protein B
MNQAINLGLLIGAPATIILYEWATPLTTLIYNAPEAGVLLKILAPMFFLHYFDAPLHAILLGLGRAKAMLVNYIVATAFRGISIFVLGSQMGISGVAYGIGIGIVMQTLLNFLTISSSIGFYWSIRPFVKVGICTMLMAIGGHWAYSYVAGQGVPELWCVITSIICALCIYLVALILTGTLNWKSTRHRFSIPW